MVALCTEEIGARDAPLNLAWPGLAWTGPTIRFCRLAWDARHSRRSKTRTKGHQEQPGHWKESKDYEEEDEDEDEMGRRRPFERQAFPVVLIKLLTRGGRRRGRGRGRGRRPRPFCIVLFLFSSKPGLLALDCPLRLRSCPPDTECHDLRS